MDDALETLHVLAVVLLGGTILVDSLAGPVIAQLKTVAELRALTRVTKLNQYLAISASILIPVFGYATAGELDLSLTTTWLLVAQIAFWIAFVIGVFFLARGAIDLANRVSRLPDGPIPSEVMGELKSPVVPAIGMLLTAAFVFIVYLMVAKPAW